MLQKFASPKYICIQHGNTLGCASKSLKLSWLLFHTPRWMLAIACNAYEIFFVTIHNNDNNAENDLKPSDSLHFWLILYIKIRFIRKFKVKILSLHVNAYAVSCVFGASGNVCSFSLFFLSLCTHLVLFEHSVGCVSFVFCIVLTLWEYVHMNFER